MIRAAFALRLLRNQESRGVDVRVGVERIGLATDINVCSWGRQLAIYNSGPTSDL